MIKMNNHVNFIANIFFRGFARNNGDVKIIVIHGTGGGGTLSWIKNCDPYSKRGQKYKNGNGLFHYLIERDGSIHNLVDPDKWVYHSSTGRNDRHTIGIELLNPSPGNLIGYTDVQYKALIDLIEFIKSTYKNIYTVISHNNMKKRFNRTGKVCPGPLFSWKKLAKAIKFKYIKKGLLEK